MKKYTCLLFLSFFGQLLFGQDIFINGSNQNRVLTWKDFTGNPDQNSPHAANTSWNLNYRYEGFSLKGDTVKLRGLWLTLKLDPNFTWVKTGKETPALLKHEQGHFDIGLICLQEMISKLNNTVYLKKEFPGKLQADFSLILDKYRSMGVQYDQETKHSQDSSMQEKWNDLFSNALKKAGLIF